MAGAAALYCLVRPFMFVCHAPRDLDLERTPPAASPGYQRLPPEAARGLVPQSLEEYAVKRPAPDPARTRLYLLPLGWPPASRNRLLGLLAEHSASYFGCPTEILAPETLSLAGIANRHHPEGGQLQLHTKDVLARLKERLPADAQGLMAITALDLYPEPGWNFVFADSSPQDRGSVMSLSRYHPPGPQAAMSAPPAAGSGGLPGPGLASWLTAEPSLAPDPLGASPDQLAVLRALKVTTSQVGRVMGLAPCVEYRCTMNWTNSMAELDARPLHACPDCLAKLEAAFGFDPDLRARELTRRYSGIGLPAEAAWYAGRTGRPRSR